MKGINLINNGGHQYIVSASGKKARANKLEVGKTYLHQNLRSLRTITEISLTTIYYEQGHRLGSCSRKSFIALCPCEATEAEIEFLNKL